MKKFKIGVFLIVLVIGMTILVGCNPIKLDKTYTHYIYNGFDGEFVKTGNSLEFYDDYAYREVLQRSKTDDIETPYVLKGNYIYDKASKSIYGEFFSQSFASFVKDYKKELIANGTNSFIADMICGSLSKETTYMIDSDVIFKLSSVQAARTGDVEDNLNTLEGVYNISGTTASGVDTILLKRGIVYTASGKLDENEKLIYDEKMGTYTVSGRFLTLTPDKQSSNKVPASQKYLISNVKFATISDDMIVKDGMTDEEYLDAQKLVKAISNKRIKVLILDFYSTQNF